MVTKDLFQRAAEESQLEFDKEILRDLKGDPVDLEISSIERILSYGEPAYAEAADENGIVLRAFRSGKGWTVQLVSPAPVDVVFDNAHDAAKTFVEIRHEHRIGF